MENMGSERIKMEIQLEQLIENWRSANEKLVELKGQSLENEIELERLRKIVMERDVEIAKQKRKLKTGRGRQEKLDEELLLAKRKNYELLIETEQQLKLMQGEKENEEYLKVIAEDEIRKKVEDKYKEIKKLEKKLAKQKAARSGEDDECMENNK